jgi:feruloyl esterase
MKILAAGSCAVLLATLVQGQTLNAAASCESLSSLTLANTTITLAQTVPAGEFSLPTTGAALARRFGNLPALCRVAATLKPSSDSDIKIEVWLPTSGWNGKFQGVGNGGFAGSISYGAMVTALNRGYATASTDTGHVGSGVDGSWALGHPERVVDFGYRAIHEATVKAKAIVQAFYDRGARLSYFVGCSQGGRQGLMEAQRYPTDYNAIVVGAPVNFVTHLVAGKLWIASATLKDPASFIPPTQYRLINQAALAACDARDGVTDGLINDPTRCDFDPKTLLCQGAASETCLTAAQVEAVKKIYSGLKNPRTGRDIYPGMARGSELGWAAMAGGPNPHPFSTEPFKYLVFGDPNWDWRTFDFDADVAKTDAKLASHNAVDPNLKAFKSRGGKIIMYDGWNADDNIALNSVNYYNSVFRVFGAKQTDEFLRLFMAPGMGHCGGGPGPNTFDALTALEPWVEQNKAPETFVASHSTNGVVDRTRPLCPYPQVAQYKGVGSTDDAANFACKAP